MAEADLRARLREGVILLDGGLGTQLIAAGLARGCAPERWNSEHADRVEAAHRAYVEAGSDIIHTNTFGGTPHKLSASGLSRERCGELNAAGVAIARRAAEGRVLVAGDVGPSGLLLPPMGAATVEQLRSEFKAQIEALCAAGVDLIAIETMYDLRECLAALEAARSITALPIFASMTFETKRRGTFTMVGDPLVGALEALVAAGADAVGCNCSVTPETMLPMISEASASVNAPIIAQPNAGAPSVAAAEGCSYDYEPAEFVDRVGQIVDAGARVVGGCCGTDPRVIARLRSLIDARTP